MNERKFDCLLSYDPRSKNYRMRDARPAGIQRSRRWHCPIRLDQGHEGKCVGYAGAHLVACEPFSEPGVDERYAEDYYLGAKKNDQWPGENYEGSSILGLMMYWFSTKAISEFRWCMGFGELCETLATRGAVIAGGPWPEHCRNPHSNGRIFYSGEHSAAHVIVFDEIDFEHQRIWVLNTWGSDWGVNGRAWLSFDDVEKMFKGRWQFAIPLEKKVPVIEKRKSFFSWLWPF